MKYKIIAVIQGEIPKEICKIRTPISALQDFFLGLATLSFDEFFEKVVPNPEIFDENIKTLFGEIKQSRPSESDIKQVMRLCYSFLKTDTGSLMEINLDFCLKKIFNWDSQKFSWIDRENERE